MKQYFLNTSSIIDIIILSYAKNEALADLTIQTIDSLIKSEEKLKFNIVVIESNKIKAPYQYPHTTTIYPEEPFGFHKYLNIGIKSTSNSYVCLCNNDLLFKRGWASEILNAFNLNKNLKSANPICPSFLPTRKFLKSGKIKIANRHNIFSGILTGWCIFLKREVFESIGLLDEQFVFWYCDRDYGNTLLKNKVKHALITESEVIHLANQTHSILDDEEQNVFMQGQLKVYEAKWGNQSRKLITRIIKKLKLISS